MKKIVYLIILFLFLAKIIAFAQVKALGYFTVINKLTMQAVTEATLINLSTGETYNADQKGVIKVNMKSASFNYRITANNYELQEGFIKVKNRQDVNAKIFLAQIDSTHNKANSIEKNFEINGFVYEYGTGLPLKNTLVTIQWDSTTVRTNAKGFYTYTSKKTIKPLSKKEKPLQTSITYVVKNHKTLIKLNIAVLPTVTRYTVNLKKGAGVLEEKNSN